MSPLRRWLWSIPASVDAFRPSLLICRSTHARAVLGADESRWAGPLFETPPPPAPLPPSADLTRLNQPLVCGPRAQPPPAAGSPGPQAIHSQNALTAHHESSSHQHPPALISSSTTTSALVSHRRAPPSRLSATEARRHHARTPSESIRCGGDRWRMPAEPSGSRSRRRIRGCPAPSRHGEICPADGTHSPATCATQRGSVGRALRDGLQPCLRLETLLNRYTAVVSTVTVTLTQLVRSPVPGHVVSAGCARGLWVPVHRVLRPKRRLRLCHQRRWLLRRLQPVGPPPWADRPE